MKPSTVKFELSKEELLSFLAPYRQVIRTTNLYGDQTCTDPEGDEDGNTQVITLNRNNKIYPISEYKFCKIHKNKKSYTTVNKSQWHLLEDPQDGDTVFVHHTYWGTEVDTSLSPEHPVYQYRDHTWHLLWDGLTQQDFAAFMKPYYRSFHLGYQDGKIIIPKGEHIFAIYRTNEIDYSDKWRVFGGASIRLNRDDQKTRKEIQSVFTIVNDNYISDGYVTVEPYLGCCVHDPRHYQADYFICRLHLGKDFKISIKDVVEEGEYTGNHLSTHNLLIAANKHLEILSAYKGTYGERKDLYKRRELDWYVYEPFGIDIKKRKN